MPVNKEIGARLRQIRVRLGETQGQFAERFSLGAATMSLYENGRIPNEEVLAWLIANGYSLDWLFTGEGSMLRTAPQDDFAKLLKAVMDMAREKGML